MMLNINSVVGRNPDIISADTDQEVVMVSVASGFYYGVADIAKEIWAQLAQTRKVSELIDLLMNKYEVDRATCENQTLAFLEELLAEGLIQESNETSN